MDPLFDGACLWLAASMTLSLGLRARSLGLSRAARGSFAVALWLVCWSFVLASYRREWLHLSGLAGAWFFALAQAVWCARAASRASTQAEGKGFGPRLRILYLGYALLAVLEVSFAAPSLLAAKGLAASSAAIIAVLALCSLAFAVTLAAVGLARRHERRGAQRLAWLGWGLALLSGGAPLLTAMLAVCGASSWFPWLLTATVPFVTPLATRLLVGKGPVPLDLQVIESPVPTRVFEGRALVSLAALALGTQLWVFSRHFGPCAGTLKLTPTPAAWRTLPVIAEGDGTRLGRFIFRANHFSWKGYPSEYANAQLGDPALCFRSTVSLRTWFDGNMYRSPVELHLRREQSSQTYVVSASESGNVVEQPLAAFTIQERLQRSFDSELSQQHLLAAATLLALGVAVCAFRLRNKHEGNGSLFLSAALLLAALVVPLVLEESWASDGTPRPGRELAVEHGWLI